MDIIFASDHAGFDLKEALEKEFSEQFRVHDVGTQGSESVDYPDFADKALDLMEKKVGSVAILVCGSGQGMAMRANRRKGIRAALCWNEEIAKLAREHNNANVLCLPGRFVSKESGLEIAKVFLEAKFAGGRHEARVQKLDADTARSQ